MRTKVVASVLLATVLCAAAQATGTDIVRKPAKWRGTILEGTDALIATEKYGYPLFIQSGETVAKQFEPAPVTGERLAAEFKKLCLETSFDQVKLAAAAPSSSFKLTNRIFVVNSRKGDATFTANLWVSPEARAQVWNSDTGALAGKDTQSRWRNGATISGFRSKDVLSPSCNLTVMTTDLHDPSQFVSAMNLVTGVAPAKSVIKSQWADGNWQLTGPDGQLRVYYSMTDLDRSEQLVHVAVSRVAAKD